MREVSLLRVVSVIVVSVSVVSAVGTAPAAAQVIRSYEALDQAAGTGWYTTVGLSLALSGGNVEFTEIDASGAVGYRGERHFVRFYPAYRIRAQDGVSIDEEQAFHLRHSYRFSETLQSYAFAQHQTDLALALDRRVLLGGGMRARLVALEGGGVELGLGAMWESERVTGEGTETDVRGANLLVINGRAGVVELNFTGFHQPLLGDWGDVRLAGSGTAAVPLGSTLALTVAARWRRDTDPPAGVLQNDYGLTVGLRFSVN